MSELKACPFCGSEVQNDERGEKYPRKSPMGGWIIHCERCGASLSQFRKSGKGEISWNTRPIEDDLRKRIAELEGMIEILEDQQREAKNILIDKKLHIDSLYEEGYKLQQRIAELEAESERFTVHSDIERQDDKWIPEVQE